MFSQIQILVRISKFSEENSTRFSTSFRFKNFQKTNKLLENLPRSLQENPIDFSNKKARQGFFFFLNNLQVQNFLQNNNNNNNNFFFFLRKLSTHFGSKFFGNQQVSTTLTNFHHTSVKFQVEKFGVFLLH